MPIGTGLPSVQAITALIVAVTGLITALTALYHALKAREENGKK